MVLNTTTSAPTSRQPAANSRGSDGSRRWSRQMRTCWAAPVPAVRTKRRDGGNSSRKPKATTSPSTLRAASAVRQP